MLIAVLLLIFWFLISASLDWQHIFTGILLSISLTLFWDQLTIDEHGKTIVNWRQLKISFRYLIFLFVEIVKANFVVAAIVLSPKMPISPGLIVLKVTLKKDLSRVLYANSITITPGTITVDLEGDRLLVHGMTKDHAFGVRSWYMYDIMKDLEESA
ncbi:MAG: Na+/H+ antiporter subunit E [Dethiobacter sp.]|nr:MAG: Na+/H+ antiporter subunit E [Dethiobacter sp.]